MSMNWNQADEKAMELFGAAGYAAESIYGRIFTIGCRKREVEFVGATFEESLQKAASWMAELEGER
jgi:hypothetical protein